MLLITEESKDCNNISTKYCGLSYDQLQGLLESTKINVIASGGVSSLEDIKKLKKISINYQNLVGVIVGKAIYEKRLQVEHAVNFLNKTNEN